MPVSPDPILYPAMLILAARQSLDLPTAGGDEHPTERLIENVATAHRRLSACYGRHGQGATPKDDAAVLSERALDLAATLVRGLNDGLASGDFSGFTAIDETNVAELVASVGQAPRPAEVDNARFDRVVDGWMLAISRHVGLITSRSSEVGLPREVFAALGSAAAFAAALAHRTSGRR